MYHAKSHRVRRGHHEMNHAHAWSDPAMQRQLEQNQQPAQLYLPTGVSTWKSRPRTLYTDRQSRIECAAESPGDQSGPDKQAG